MPLHAAAGNLRAYDIRGVVGRTLTPPIVHAIGRARTLAGERGRDTIVIGRDGRLSGRACRRAGRRHRASGADVIDIGMVATPMTYSPRTTSTRGAASWSPAATIRPTTTASRW
jgi:phosphomannomutase/phosphoglucomutase